MNNPIIKSLISHCNCFESPVLSYNAIYPVINLCEIKINKIFFAFKIIAELFKYFESNVFSIE